MDSFEETRQELELLLVQLLADVQLCTTRDQHIRAVTRVNYLTEIISRSSIRA